jgi:hypothetical protein
MTPEALLVELENCTHAQRMRRMVELGQRLTRGQEPELPALLAGLAEHESAYARMLALQSCMGSRDGAHVVRALADISRTVRRRAAGVVPHACDDAQAVIALGLVSGRRVRARLVASLVRRGRGGVVDTFLEARIASKSRPDAHAADLLPLASLPALARSLPAFREATSPLGWARLAAWHPEVAAAELLALVIASPTVEPRLRACFAATLRRISRLRPELAVNLVRGLLEHGVTPTDHLVTSPLLLLARRIPGAVFDVLHQRHTSGDPAPPPGAFAGMTFDKGAQRLGADRISFLIRHAWSTLPEDTGGRRWFLHLSPADRAQILAVWLREGQESWGTFLFCYAAAAGPEAEAREAAFQRWSNAAQRETGVIHDEEIRCLPADLRNREVRRHLYHVDYLTTATGERLEYAGYLPFTEAQEYLATWLGHPVGEQRAQAIKVLIGTVRFERARMIDALALVRRRKNEQDPVRLAMFEALRSLPLGAFLPGHLEEVGAAIAEGLDAADLSHATAWVIEQLVVRLFRVDPAWAARWLARIIEVRGATASAGLQEQLTEAHVLTLAPALTDLIASWLTRERAGQLISLAQALGKRLALIPTLVAALERLAAELPFLAVADPALQLLHSHARRRFTALVPGLLAADPSFSIVPVVARYVSEHRQDLLDPLLESAPMQGRFATGQTRWALDFEGGFFRWTPRQQGLHAASQTAILANADCPVPDARKALQTLARLVFIAPITVLARASDARPPVRDLAVIALTWLDQGQGTPVLVEALGDARARIAIYALRKALQEMSEDRVLALLRAVPRTKVTVAKEIVRLLGALGGEEAFADLVAMDQPELHHNVRIALLRAMWDHLEKPEAWAVLDRAAADPDLTVAMTLFGVPMTRLNAERDARLSGLLARLLVRPGIEGRGDLLQRVALFPLVDGERRLFNACLALMSSPHFREYGAATTAVLERMRPEETEIVSACIETLMKEPRVLLEMLRALAACIGPYAAKHRNQVALHTLTALAPDPRMAGLHLRLSSLLLPWRHLADLLSSLASRDALHADLMVQALDAAQRCVEPEPLESALATQSDARLRRVALAALEASAARHGWTPARRQRLLAFREDFSALVSSRALFVFPPDEIQSQGA